MKIRAIVSAIAGLALSGVTSHAQLSLNFASTPGSTIQFNGTNNTFQFNSSIIPGPLSGSQWQIGSESGGVGSAVGLLGVVNNSPFSYGPISSPFPGLQIATVIGPLGALAISDGVGNFLTGTVAWIELDSYVYAGGINPQLVVNLTGLAYGGSNPDLQTLVADSPASMDLTFQFAPGMTLSALSTGSGPYDTSYSGSLSAVPEPATVGCFLLGLSVLACARRFRK
jgi:hypothetical protein